MTSWDVSFLVFIVHRWMCDVRPLPLATTPTHEPQRARRRAAPPTSRRHGLLPASPTSASDERADAAQTQPQTKVDRNLLHFTEMKLHLIGLFVACVAILAPALAAKGDEFDRRLTAFSKHWEQYGARRLTLDSPVVKGLGRRLEEGSPNLFEMLIGGAQATIGVVNGAVGAVQQVLNLFGRQSSESLVGQFTNQGFSHFNQRTRIQATTLPTAIFDSYVESALKNVYQIPSKHKDGIDHIVKFAKYVDNDSWLALESSFDMGSGGTSQQIQMFTSKDIECKRMNVVFVFTEATFKLKPDLFIISKSESRLGGAFSNTKLQWKNKDASLRVEDLKFVSEYFLALGMAQIQQSQTIVGFAGTRNCGDYGAPPEQINPFDNTVHGSRSCRTGYVRYRGRCVSASALPRPSPRPSPGPRPHPGPRPGKSKKCKRGYKKRRGKCVRKRSRLRRLRRWDGVDVTKPVGPNTMFFDRRHTHPDYDWRDPHKALDWSKVRAPRRLSRLRNRRLRSKRWYECMFGVHARGFFVHQTHWANHVRMGYWKQSLADKMERDYINMFSHNKQRCRGK